MPLAVSFDRFGLGNLRLDRRAPEPLAAGMVRVAVAAVTLNRRDLLVVRGTYAADLALPLVPCSDAAGTIVETAADIFDLAPGDRVCTHMAPDWQDGPLEPRMRRATLGGPAPGVLCEERVLPRGAVTAIPDSLSFEESACLPTAGLAAWSALGADGGIGRGSHVLLPGTGGMAMLALAIAKALGAQAAIASSSDDKLARAAALGADLAVNNRREGWVERVREWSGGGVDLALDIGGAASLDRSLRAVRDGGLVAVLGIMGSDEDARPPDLAQILMRGIRLHGIFVGNRAELDHLIAFVAENRIAPVIDRVFDGLGSAREAFARLAGGRHMGKIVIRAGG